MKFIYQGETLRIALFGDVKAMGAYCDDLLVFGLKPDLIAAEGVISDGEAVRGVPVRPLDMLTGLIGTPNLVIVSINQSGHIAERVLRELDSRLPESLMRDIELLLRLSIQSKVEGLPALSGARSDVTLLPMQLGFVLGGLETWVTNLYHQMKRDGRSVMILEPRQDSFYEYVGAEFYRVAPDEVLSMGPYPSFMPYVERMIELMAANPPKVYVDNGSYRLMAAMYILKTQLKLPTEGISVLHGDMNIVYNRVTLCEGVIDRFVAVSDPVREHLIQRLEHRAADVSVQIQLPPAHPESLETRDQSGSLRIAYAARLEKSNKRAMWLTEVMDALAARGVAFELFIAGDGECYEQLKAHIQIMGLEDHVHLCGKIPREDMDAFWRDKHAFINFSVSEGGPLTLFESMSHGLVPVVTNAGSAGRLVFPGKSGYIIDSPIEAADALCALAGDKTLRAALQRGALQAFLDLQRNMRPVI